MRCLQWPHHLRQAPRQPWQPWQVLLAREDRCARRVELHQGVLASIDCLAGAAFASAVPCLGMLGRSWQEDSRCLVLALSKVSGVRSCTPGQRVPPVSLRRSPAKQPWELSRTWQALGGVLCCQGQAERPKQRRPEECGPHSRWRLQPRCDSCRDARWRRGNRQEEPALANHRPPAAAAAANNQVTGRLQAEPGPQSPGPAGSARGRLQLCQQARCPAHRALPPARPVPSGSAPVQAGCSSLALCREHERAACQP